MEKFLLVEVPTALLAVLAFVVAIGLSIGGLMLVRQSVELSTLPEQLWWVLMAGGVITIGFTYFFGVRSLGAQILMVAALAGMISLTLFLILSLDLPFSGDLAVPPTAMTHAVAEFAHAPA